MQPAALVFPSSTFVQGGSGMGAGWAESWFRLSRSHCSTTGRAALFDSDASTRYITLESRVERERRRTLRPRVAADGDSCLKDLFSLDAARVAGEDPDPTAYAAGLAACAATLRWKPARRLLREMTQRRLQISSDHVVTALEASSQNWDSALCVLRWAESEDWSVSTAAYNTALEACVFERRWTEALHILQELHEADDSPGADEETYSVVARACIGEWYWALKTLRLAEERQKSSRGAYLAALSACERCQRTQWVLRVLHDMRAAGIDLDHEAFDVAIQASGKARNWLKAVALLEEARVLDALPRTASAYSAALEACSKGLAWQHALWAMGLMETQRVIPDHIGFQAITEALQASEHPELVEKIKARSSAALKVSRQSAAVQSMPGQKLGEEELERLQWGF